MNSENLNRVADAIEKHEIKNLGFNMNEYISDLGYEDKSGHNCGTTACIAGYAACLSLNVESLNWQAAHYYVAREFLGLTEGQAHDLFNPVNVRDISSEEAVCALRHAAKHGKIDWEAD